MYQPRLFAVSCVTTRLTYAENALWRNKRLENKNPVPKEEDSAAKAKQLAEKLRFRLKEASAQRGGSEAFLHWLRSDAKKGA
jgi:hypothetical protein